MKLLFFFLLISPVLVFGNLNFSKDLSLKAPELGELSSALTQQVFSDRLWPADIKLKDKTYKVDYTINKKLSKYINRELRRYRSDYASVVVIDNNNGHVCAGNTFISCDGNNGKTTFCGG